ncbi:hypothetical protein ACPF8X_03155 [Streptomyces sp. G35A]
MSCGSEFGALLAFAVAAGAGGFYLGLYAVLDGCEGRLYELGTVRAAHVRLHVLGGG